MDQQEQSLYLWRTLARGWKILLATVILVTAAAVSVSYLLPTRWEAKAVITVEPISAVPLAGGASSAVQVNMNTESVVAQSTEVLSRAVNEVPGLSIRDLRRSLTVSVPKGSQVLEFTVSTDSADLAPKAANAVALAYNRQRIESAERVIDETTQSLVERIVALEQARDAAQEGTAEHQTLTLQISSLQERQASLTAATFYPGTLVSPAATPNYPSNFPLKTFVVAGGFLGVLLGFGLALAYDKYIEYRLRDAKLTGPTRINPSASDPIDPIDTAV